MKSMIAKYILYVYVNYIKDDFYYIKPSYLGIVRSLWFIRSTIIWIMSIFLFPFYIIGNNMRKRLFYFCSLNNRTLLRK